MPGSSAATSNVVDPPTTVAVAAASSSTRTDSSEMAPAVPVTWSITSTLVAASIESITAKDCAARSGCGETRTMSDFAAVPPAVSATVTISSMSSSVPPPSSSCW